MLFRQFVDDDLGCASYLIGDEKTGEAVLVDPAYAIERYLVAADRQGVRITRVLETHTHADHVSGHGRLALEHGVPVSVHPAAGVFFPHDELADGQEIRVGDVTIGVMHTPGHRPEHCCFTVTDRSRGDKPWLVLSGDSLFVGDAARPDLAVEAEEGARALQTSLRHLMVLADGVEVYPGHVAGSLCGAGMSSKPSTTIGFERSFNRLLQIDDEREFINALTGTGTPKPPTLERVVALNSGQFVGAPERLEPVSQLLETTVLDVRPAEEFAQGHAHGAINVPLERSGFATKAGFVLEAGEPLALHVRSVGEAEEAGRRLHAAGIFELVGYVLEPPGEETLDPIEIDELERLVAENSVEVIDVREKDERDEGYIAGSRHIPYRLLRGYADELENGRPFVTICSSGSRAAVAASILAAAGHEARPVLHGGVPAWEQRGNQTVAFRRCGG
ncbi:MAG: MBL fold metallo-hydrolase [Actinomycetota bacterium]|nr:MBL fold metallo-hydrolase [Actinomycetota bacterium]